MDFSRASTVTLGRDDPRTAYQMEVDDDPDPEEVPDRLLEEISNRSHSKRLIIAIDFGTTYSAVSYVSLAEGESGGYLSLDRIRSVQNFPDDWNLPGDRMKSEVPTEVIYPLNRHFRKKEDLDVMDVDQEDVIDGSMNGAAEVPGGEANPTASDQEDEESDGPISDDDDSDSFRWGYRVHEAWAQPATHCDRTNQPLSRFKLILDNSPTTELIRNQLGLTLETLQRKRIIKKPLYVIADFLTCLLRHTKSYLRAEGFDDSYGTEIVLCVPAIWSQKACRDMQMAMAIALRRVRFEGVDIQNNSIENLFIVSEPEAAAAYVLAMEREITPGETFVLLDAGGGTVDANTYKVSATTPLRLTREVVAPGGGLYGSSYLNEGFRKLLHNLLDSETYLTQGTETIDGIIEKIMINEFEYRIKRSFDYYGVKGVKRFSVSGLRDNAEKNFKKGSIHISTEQIKKIFHGCLEGIASIMEDQIKAAKERGSQVEKVLLIGGFAESASLKKHIEKRLEKYCKENHCHIKPIRPENVATAVASGAVLRAFNKEQGPQRQARSSYGIMRTEHFGEYDEHDGLKPSYDPYDGLPYIKKTVDWVLKLGVEVPPVWQCRPFLCSHTFPCWPPRPLICREVLYVSDTSTKSHYRLDDPRNEGAEKVGDIVVDFTFLREQGLIRPIEPEFNKNGRKIGTRHYKVNYTMVIFVVDRDLSCYAIYDGQVMKKCRINIASAFRPGAK